MDLKLVQKFLPYAAVAIITTLSLWSRRSRRCRAKSGRSNDSDDEEAEVSSLLPSSQPLVREDGFQYDVFLSFRGADTRKTFADLLYQALKDKGITTFIDSKKLEKGQKLEVLLECIQRSKICVPFFSSGYAGSVWCLKEVAKMVECKRVCERVLVPVFVDVEPTDVRRQAGLFGSAFSKHRKNKEIDEVEVSEWSNAWSVAGYTLATTNGHQGKLIQQIVKRILSEVNRTCKLHVAEHPVGLDSRIVDVIKVLETEAQDDVRMVGICGMGGIGKTTLSKAVYNEISSNFDACSFISNVREKAERPSGLFSLQKQLLGDVFNEKDVTISSTSDGLGKIKGRIGAKKVLLVLDDVNDASQINELLGNLKRFCSGSRIIITTRDKRVLTSARVKENHVYELKGLDDIQSLELFSWHAFGKKEPDAKFAELSNQVASTAAGLPLALTIFGSHFFDLKTDKHWRAALKKLKENLDKDIFDRLRISFDMLDKSEKEVFLDIACFFVGQETKCATLMWEACGFYPEIAIDWLIHKSLVSINNKGIFEMHDLVRDMGRKIVQDKAKEAGKHTRLWNDDETLDVLQNKRGIEDVEAIKLFRVRKEGSVYVDLEHLAAMSQLRMLLLQGVTLKGGYEHFPRKLRWLKSSPQALEKLPSSLHLEMIAVLDLSCSSITQVCDPQKMTVKVFDQLKVLDLSYCRNLSISPDFESMIHLEMLSFKGCHKMSELHPSIGFLKRLTHLSLGDCSSLKELPQEVWQLTKLEEFDLCNCFKITTLPSLKQHLLGELKVLKLGKCHSLTMCPDFMGMPYLEILDFECCEKMSELHPSIGHLKSLINLNLSCCTSLREVPQEVWQLTSLLEFNLFGCNQITALPSQIWNAESLKQLLLERLDLQYCSNLITCPDFMCMPHLQELWFSYCEKMTKLDPSIGQLKRLRMLDLSGCESLKELPQEIGQLTSLKWLSLGGCKKITELNPSIGQLKRLTKLDLEDCKSLKKLPQEIGQLTSLTWLTLRGCSSLKEVPQEVWQLTSLPELDFFGCKIIALPSHIRNAESLKLPLLERLVLDHCSNLIMCPDFRSMPHLQSLSFRYCEKITKLDPSIGQLTSLKELILEGCSSLKDVPQEIWQLTSLPKLDFSGCSQITALPSQVQIAESLKLPLLERLVLRRCSNLITCPDFRSMPHLQSLSFSYCEKITKLDPSIGKLEKLTELDLKGCKSLKELPQEIGQLTSLKWLTLEDCSSLKEVPQEVWQLTSLRKLDFSGCSQITALPSQMQNAESLKQPLLERLVLSGCSNLIRCPDFKSMPHLQSLSFRGCEKMTELNPLIGQLKRLMDLDLYGCKLLKELPQEIGQLTSLEKLTLQGCSSLKEVPQEVWQLTSLQQLNLLACTEITALPSQIRNAESLKQPLLKILDLSNCSGLITCPDFTSMPHLHGLCFSGCEKMTELDPSIWQLMKLRELNLSGCKSLKQLPQELGQLTFLRSLKLSRCSSLKEVPSLPPSLKELNASHCDQLESMGNVSSLKELKWLSLSGCIRLEDVPGIEQLKCLRRLRLGECRRLPDSLLERVQGLDLLETLDLCNWENLTKRPAFTSLLNWLSNLKYLRELDLSWTDIEELPVLTSSMEGLKELELTGCRKLVHIPGIEQLKRLEKLMLAGCRSLHDSFFERLQAANFRNLRRLSIPGRLINERSTDPQSITFILPKQFDSGLLCLYVDQRSLDNICSELEKSNGASTLLDKSVASEYEVTQPVDGQLGRSVVHIDITTDDAHFSFPTFINGWGESGRFPTATFAKDSELMMMAKQGRFKGNDAQGRGLMEMCVSIDGCVLLHGDLWIPKWTAFEKDKDACRVSHNIVHVSFG